MILGLIVFNLSAYLVQVILYLYRSLKHSVFRQILLENRIAADHYLRYLETKNEVNHLVDLLKYGTTCYTKSFIYYQPRNLRFLIVIPQYAGPYKRRYDNSLQADPKERRELANVPQRNGTLSQSGVSTFGR